jgi:NAD(P)-dependent dehydrogenase (short-subunit alcohol dehydrogenase family)
MTSMTSDFAVGSVVAFLASQDARWITGDTIRVDGGSKL